MRTRIAVVLLALAACSRTGLSNPREQIVALQFDPAEPSLPVGGELDVVVQGVKANGSTVDLSDALWFSDDARLISFDAQQARAHLRGLGRGDALLSASARGLTGTVVVHVTAPAPVRLEISPTSPTLAIGGTLQLQATAIMSDSTTQTITSLADWSSADPSIARFTDPKGTLLGAAEGQVQVQASWSGLTANATVSVSGKAPVRLEIDPPQLTMPVGTVFHLRAIAVYADAATSDVTEAVSWSSDTPSLITVADVAGERGNLKAYDAGTATISASWQGLSAQASVTAVAATLTSVEVDPPLLELAKGTRGQLTALALYSDGTRIDVTAAATWDSGNSKVASADPKTPGQVLALSPGSADLTATFLSKKGFAPVRVTAAVLQSLEIQPNSAALPKGTTKRFKAVGTYSDGATQDLTDQVVWASADKAIASVSNAAPSQGEVTALAIGTTGLTATLGTAAARALLTVSAAQLVSLTVAPQTATLAKGTDLALKATATFSDNSTLDVTDQVFWLSSAPTIASVTTLGTGRGVVHGVGLGNASIAANWLGQSSKAAVTVTPATLVSLALKPLNPTLSAGAALQMTAWGTYSDGTSQEVTTLVLWTLVDPRIAGISNAAGSNGLVTGLSAGTTALQASLSGKTAQTTLTVTPALLTGLIVTPPFATLDYQANLQASATAFYSDGTSVAVTNSANWTSDNPSVASVVTTGAVRGVITGNRAGSAVITASFGGLTAQMKVAVNGPKPNKLVVAPASLSLNLGDKSQLTATLLYPDGTSSDVTATASWTSSAPAAFVGNGASGGLVKASAPGSAVVTASASGLSGTCSVTVAKPQPNLLTVTPANADIAVGSQQPLTVRAFFPDGSSLDVTAQSSFTSADPAIVSIKGNIALGLTVGGPVTVTVVYGNLTATATFKVVATSYKSLTISPLGLTLKTGQTGNLTATVTDGTGLTMDVTAQASWSSSDLNICMVVKGMVVGVGAGTCTVTVSYGGLTATTTVAVTQAPSLSRIAIVPPKAILRTDLIYPYKAYAVMSDGTTQDVTGSATWFSANPSVVTMGTYNGYFGAQTMGAGTTTIQASYGGQTGTTDVNVRTASIQSVQVSPASIRVPVGVSVKMAGVYVYSPDGWATEISNPTWSSSNPSIVRIDANGMATGIGAGTATITVTAYGSGFMPLTATATATVTSAKLVSIAISAPSTLPVGNTARVTAAGTFSDGSVVDLGPSGQWSVGQLSLASLLPDEKGAALTGLAAGSTTLGCSFGTISAQQPLTISNATLKSLAFNVAQPKLPAGAASTLIVIGTYTDGTTLDLTGSARFDSSAPDVAIVSSGIWGNTAQPYVLAETVGNATLKATVAGVSAAAPVAIFGSTLQSIQLSLNGGAPSSSLTLSGTGPFQLTAIGTFAGGLTADVTPMCSFSPGSPGPGVVATVSNAISGKVTVLGKGSETVNVVYAPQLIGQPTIYGAATVVVP